MDELKKRMYRKDRRINELENITIEITQRENRREKSEKSLRDLWDYNRRYIIRIIGVPGREEKENGAEEYLEK